MNVPKTEKIHKNLKKDQCTDGDEIIFSKLWIINIIGGPRVEQSNIGGHERCHIAVQQEWTWIVALYRLYEPIGTIANSR